MTSHPFHNRNLSIHRTVTDLVRAYLSAQGIDTQLRRTPSGLSDAQRDDAVDPDLALPGVDLNVSSKLVHRLSEDLDSVTRGAQIRGVDVGAFVQWRGDAAVGESYVVMQLSSFTKLVRGDHLTP